MRRDIQELVDQLGLQSRVRFTGYLSDQRVLEELLAARALVLPSFAEGLPVVFLEAMALGRPVISTYIAGHPELIIPGINGWLVPAGAIEPLVDAMAEAVTASPVELERMGRAGAARIAERHNLFSQVDKLVQLLSQGGPIRGKPRQHLLSTAAPAVAQRAQGIGSTGSSVAVTA
jgi:glycosyltransferase involved in cell wall biosynthesis